MLVYHHIDPVAFVCGPLEIRWYGIMYLLGFLSAWVLSSIRCKKTYRSLTKSQIHDIIFYAFIGVIIGGRVGHVLFYDFAHFIHKPWTIINLWNGGMSFHGGLIGVILFVSLFCYKHKCNVFDALDFIAPLAPIGLGAGRLGNFINGELWGNITSSSIGIVFPYAGPLPRHPSQLYEFLLEGVILFLILWFISSKPCPRSFISAHFLLWYGIFRFIAELFRQPDLHIGYLFFDWVTIGQLLSLPMIITGLVMLLFTYTTMRKKNASIS